MMHLIPVKEPELGIVSELARLIWNDHYVPIIGKEQVDYMLAKMYNHESLKEQLNKKQVFYFISKDQKNIGFLSVSSENGADFFLHKFYIDQQQAGAGIGTQTFNVLLDIIKPKSLTLTVNRQNFKSINFYFKNGFKINRVEDFDIGDGYQMNDFVMVRMF